MVCFSLFFFFLHSEVSEFCQICRKSEQKYTHFSYILPTIYWMTNLEHSKLTNPIKSVLMKNAKLSISVYMVRQRGARLNQNMTSEICVCYRKMLWKNIMLLSFCSDVYVCGCVCLCLWMYNASAYNLPKMLVQLATSVSSHPPTYFIIDNDNNMIDNIIPQNLCRIDA